ncbi:MalY/PatB family protein [Sediminibacillus albus]|uniref:cysteine-S-conjugate beta-lyase n=1 Tax=Sediminibacillus albus TaxID=407036 RepID=A0A1G8Z0W7_9BACI|nr:PatB family C-S lyase [Sediminibacillus albus]SDK08294.1 cystathione beta-lyase [Sediminibacillus albus]
MHTFNEVRQRTGTRSVKWDLIKSIYGSNDVLPMWVADMDIPVPEPVRNALVSRAEHGIFGYTVTDHLINQSVSNWMKTRHDWEIHHSWLLYSPGVITSLHMAVQALTSDGDKLMIQTPVYPPFYDLVHMHNRQLVKNPLKLEGNRYTIDFEAFEAELKQGVKAFILCNPHNPVGRVWTEDELRKIGELCLKYGVLIFSDEIHADIVYAGHKHTPIASLSKEINEITITCMSPTKSFNLAGLQVSYLISPDKHKREKIDKYFHMQGIKILNTMGITALEAAYNDGQEWLDDLHQLLEGNKRLVEEAFESRKEINVIPAEGTYLIWLDCRPMKLSNDQLKKFMQEQAKVGLNDGLSFGEEGEGFMRINIACPRVTVEEGINRIIKALNER